MDFTELYHFLFETYNGILVLVGGGIIISIIVSIIFEIRTRKHYYNHEPTPEEDEWSIFEDEVAEAEVEAEAKANKSDN